MAYRSENRAAALAAFARVFGVLCGLVTASSALLSAGCTAKITEVVVVVDTDLRIPAQIDSIDVRVTSPGQTFPGLDAPLDGPTRNSLPLTVGLRSESDSDTPFSVVVRGLLRGSEQIRAEVSTRFVPGERRVLRIRLTESCLGVMCRSGDTTCRDGECRDIAVDPQLLPPLSSLDLGVDAQAIDGGPVDSGLGDAAIDAAIDDAGPDGGGSCTAGDAGVVGSPVGCTPARPDARPECADDGETVGPLHFAMRDIVIDQGGDRWRTLGFDLDGQCTDALAPMPSAECAPRSAPAPTDGRNGIDNTFGGEIVQQFLTYQPDFSTNTTVALENGRTVPIVTLDRWNGLPDDPRVQLSVAFAVDLIPAGETVTPGSVTLDNTYPDPMWDGTDTAYPSSSSFGAGGRAVLFDDNAYVAGGQIVARLPDRADLNLPGSVGVVRIRLTDVRLTGQLVDGGASLANTSLTGRWPEADLLMFLDDLGICPGDPTADLIRAGFAVILARSADVRATAGTGGPGVTCDAVSTAIPFENGIRVTLGETVPVTLLPSMCP